MFRIATPVWQQADRKTGYNDIDELSYLVFKLPLAVTVLLGAALSSVVAILLTTYYGLWGCVAAVTAALVVSLVGLNKLSRAEIGSSVIGTCLLAVAFGNLFTAPLAYFTPLYPTIILAVSPTAFLWLFLGELHELGEKRRGGSTGDHSMLMAAIFIVVPLIIIVVSYFQFGLTPFLYISSICVLSMYLGGTFACSDDLPRNTLNLIDSVAWVVGYPFYLIYTPFRLLMGRWAARRAT